MSNKGIEQLRDKLLARGLVPSQPPPPGADAPRAPQAGPEALAITERVRPFAEAIYLVLAADAQLGERERDVLRGALRALTDGVLSSVSMDNMLSDFEHARTRDGVESRLDNVASSLYGDRNDARLAIRLATAAAEAESGVSDEERAVLAALGDRLGVSEKELSELLQGSSEWGGRGGIRWRAGDGALDGGGAGITDEGIVVAAGLLLRRGAGWLRGQALKGRVGVEAGGGIAAPDEVLPWAAFARGGLDGGW